MRSARLASATLEMAGFMCVRFVIMSQIRVSLMVEQLPWESWDG